MGNSTNPDDHKRSYFSELPREVRQYVLQLALYQDRLVQLQNWMWVLKEKNSHPLYGVSRSLREEALEAYYTTNTFEWLVDSTRETRTDPIHLRDEERIYKTPLPSAHPWRYPHLFKHLRHVNLQISLPTAQDDDAWRNTLPMQLRRLIRALDQGRKLRTLHVYFLQTRLARISLPWKDDQRAALELLSEFQVRGNVRVPMVLLNEEVCEALKEMDLVRKMKA